MEVFPCSEWNKTRRKVSARNKLAVLEAKVLGCWNASGDALEWKGGATSNLRNHLKNNHSLDLSHTTTQQWGTIKQQSSFKFHIRQWLLKHGRACQGKHLEAFQLRQTTKCITKCNLSLRVVESPHFHGMIKFYDPAAKLITSTKLRQDIVTLNDVIVKIQIENIVGASLCIILDHWTLKNSNSNFVGMTAS